MKLDAGFATDPGRVRSNNEDAFLVDDSLGLFAVADGVGGHRGGEVASSTAVEALRAAIASGQAIDAAIDLANTAVFERAAGDTNLTGMGTTMTAFVPLAGSQLLIGHVGDSRAYLLRDGELSRITEDHSLVEELVRDGRITAEQAEVHPQRSIITRALGLDPSVEIDVHTITVQTSDRVMLCSDGLTTMVREREVESMLRADGDARLAAERLVDAAVANGGDDNVTVVVVDVLEADPAPPNDPATIAKLAPDIAVSTGVQPIADLPPADVGAADAGDGAGAEALGGERKRRWFRWPLRILLTLLPIAMVLGAGLAALHWVTYNQYYVGVSKGHVAIYNGDPDGALWFDPRVVTVYEGLAVDQLREVDRVHLRSGHFCLHSSIAQVQQCVDRMRTA